MIYKYHWLSQQMPLKTWDQFNSIHLLPKRTSKWSIQTVQILRSSPTFINKTQIQRTSEHQSQKISISNHLKQLISTSALWVWVILFPQTSSVLVCILTFLMSPHTHILHSRNPMPRMSGSLTFPGVSNKNSWVLAFYNNFKLLRIRPQNVKHTQSTMMLISETNESSNILITVSSLSSLLLSLSEVLQYNFELCIEYLRWSRIVQSETSLKLKSLKLPNGCNYMQDA